MLITANADADTKERNPQWVPGAYEDTTTKSHNIET